MACSLLRKLCSAAGYDRRARVLSVVACRWLSMSVVAGRAAAAEQAALARAEARANSALDAKGTRGGRE
eukprot:4594727-Pleurochrysis_carterae.AAC.2